MSTSRSEFAAPEPLPGSVPPSSPVKIVKARHPGRWVAAIVLLILVASFGRSVLSNSNFEWDVVGEYLATNAILEGLLATLYLTAICMIVGIVLGTLLAVMRLSSNPIVSGVAWVYVWFFRGTPVLVQLLFWFNIAALYPMLSFGVPFGPSFVHLDSNSLITPLLASILGLGLNEGAYMSEIVRAGIVSVDEGQTEAAESLGMTRLQTMRRIVLPQAMRVIIPPTGNETISMLKMTSLVSVIALQELLYSAQIIYARTYQTIPLLIVASIWYLAVTSVLSVGQYYVERHYAKGSSRHLPMTPLQRFRRTLTRFHPKTHDLPSS